jgi:uncharacterized membrane protein
MKPQYLRIILFLLLVVWCAGFAFPMFMDKGYAVFSGLLFSNFYSPVCHQIPEKSFNTGSGIFLVCARCSGIYIGALAASLISIIRSFNMKYIFILFIPILADVFSVNAGIYNYSKTTAFITGSLAGLALFIYILSAFEKSLSINEK